MHGFAVFGSVHNAGVCRPALRRWLFTGLAAVASFAPALLGATGLVGEPIAQRIGPGDYRASPGLTGPVVGGRGTGKALRGLRRWRADL